VTDLHAVVRTHRHRTLLVHTSQRRVVETSLRTQVLRHEVRAGVHRLHTGPTRLTVKRLARDVVTTRSGPDPQRHLTRRALPDLLQLDRTPLPSIRERADHLLISRNLHRTR